MKHLHVIALALGVAATPFTIRDGPRAAALTAEQALEACYADAAPDFDLSQDSCQNETDPDDNLARGVEARKTLDEKQLTVLRDSWTYEASRFAQGGAQQAPAASAVPKKKGFGRWLKKHWYVAVLAGVAVGVALQDDSPGDGED